MPYTIVRIVYISTFFYIGLLMLVSLGLCLFLNRLFFMGLASEVLTVT